MIIKAVRAIGAIFEAAGVRLQGMTDAELACWGSVIIAFGVAAVLVTALVAIVFNWWEIAGRYVVAIFIKDRAADFREWKERRARLQRLKAAHRANFDKRR